MDRQVGSGRAELKEKYSDLKCEIHWQAKS